MASYVNLRAVVFFHMTTTERDAESNWPSDVVIYNTTTNQVEIYRNGDWELLQLHGSIHTDGTDDIQTTSKTQKGIVELADTSEIDAGTDSTRAMPVDQFVASDRNIRFVTIRLIAADTDVSADTDIGGVRAWVCPFPGTLLQSDDDKNWCSASVDTAGSTGTMVVDVHKGGSTVMGTNKLDIETGEVTTTTATTQPDLTVTAVSAGDVFTFDVDAAHTTKAKGLSVTLAIRMT